MSMQHPTISVKHRLLLLTCLIAIAFVYIYRIGDKALDFDERYSINIATGMGGHNTQYSSFGRFIANPIPGATFSSAQYAERYRLSNVSNTTDEGATKCYSTDPQTKTAGTWALLNGDAQLNVTDGSNSVTADILVLDNGTLTIKYVTNTNGIKSTTTTSYNHQ